MTVGFVGLSHLGIISSVATASKGLDVIAYDPDPSLCEALRQGRPPIAEPGLLELLAAHQERLRVTADPEALGACALVVISTDVPTDAQNHSDLRMIHQRIEAVAGSLAPETVVIVLSQVPPGFTRRLAQTLARAHPDRGLQVFYQVETLIVGAAVQRALAPERFMVGCADPEAELPAAYAEWFQRFPCPILRMRYESAELAKISINAFLASSVCTTNMVAELCEAIRADWAEIAPALRLDKRIGPHAYLSPGLGLSGGNLERDLVTIQHLGRQAGTDTSVIDACVVNSAYRKQWALRVIHRDVLSQYPEPMIAIWGLAYKAGTRSTKNSPSLALIRALHSYPIRVFDPQVTATPFNAPTIVQTASALAACSGADALAIMTPWPEFAQIDVAKIREHLRGRVIVDPFGVLDGTRCEALGLLHVRLGTRAEAGERSI